MVVLVGEGGSGECRRVRLWAPTGTRNPAHNRGWRHDTTRSHYHPQLSSLSEYEMARHIVSAQLKNEETAALAPRAFASLVSINKNDSNARA
jgi:hypothetical protein